MISHNPSAVKIHFVIHESFEAPGAIETWAKAREHEISFTRSYENEELPQRVDDIDFLVVMGGPQSPATTKVECAYYDAQAEINLIKMAVEADKYVLGACLGAQLIGEALGAAYDHSPNREIGVFPVTLTTEAHEDPIFSRFPKEFMVGHWHGDMPGLTPESKILATSEGCPRQIVKYTPKVYGFQCHFEFTPEVIELMIENSTEELDQYKDLPYVESPEELRAHDYTGMNKLLFQFLDDLTRAYGTPGRNRTYGQ